jgi:hypothetical protein
MTTTIYRTVVVDLPPTPLGLLPGRWAVEHHCTLCRTKVPTQDLIPHARAHTDLDRSPEHRGS